MEKDSRISFWWERFAIDSQKLTYQHRLSLVKTILINHCRLTPEELSVFLNPEFTPTAEKLDETFRYTNAERKIANYYNSSFPQEGTQAYKEWKQRHDDFKNDFKQQALTIGFYEKDEIDEILSYTTVTDDFLIVIRLVGNDFYAMRRIRNAYIPGMVTAVSVVAEVVDDKHARIIQAEDITHTLFDREEDAVTQLERSLGINPKGT